MRYILHDKPLVLVDDPLTNQSRIIAPHHPSSLLWGPNPHTALLVDHFPVGGGPGGGRYPLVPVLSVANPPTDQLALPINLGHPP